MGKILGRNRREKSRFGYNKEQIIRMGFGACYIILPRYIQKLGLLDESVFLMGEEALLGNQVYSNGGEILYTPQVKVIHQDHSTFKKMQSIHTYNITKESYKVYKKLL
ncbi:MAG: glycosyltransferase family 2 protein [Bacteroides cellulosilyticus]